MDRLERDGAVFSTMTDAVDDDVSPSESIAVAVQRMLSPTPEVEFTTYVFPEPTEVPLIDHS